MMKINIGIADCSKYANYEKWFLGVKDVTVTELSYQLRNEMADAFEVRLK